eukprot:TRINITY_DN542_c1_g1_i1.p1 TRINITY_DN542_c1_g1~~TRINITY_DN542_c1_g1_i1.p1  ORF type:complete len:1662 (+),score=516.66 TRINITY_DN542_c1_g1_i1:166-4986(+)
MTGHASGGVYMMGGLSEEGELFADLWHFSPVLESWAEVTLPEAVRKESGAGAVASTSDQIVIAGGSALTHRYLIREKRWLPAVADDLSDVLQPKMVPIGTYVVMVGGVADGAPSDKVLRLNAADLGGRWEMLSHSGKNVKGARPLGGVLSDGTTAVFASTTGDLHLIDIADDQQVQWAVQMGGCKWVAATAASAGAVIGDTLYVFGAARVGDAPGLTGAYSFRFGHSLSPCDTPSPTVPRSLAPAVALNDPVDTLSLADNAFPTIIRELLEIVTSLYRFVGMCFADRRFFVLLSGPAAETVDRQRVDVAVVPQLLVPMASTVTQPSVDPIAQNTVGAPVSIACLSASPSVHVLQSVVGFFTIARLQREGDDLVFREVHRASLLDDAVDITTVERGGETFILALQRRGTPALPNGTVQVLRLETTGDDKAWNEVAKMYTPLAMADYIGMDVSEDGYVVIASRAEARLVVSRLLPDSWAFNTSIVQLFHLPEKDGESLYCAVQSVTWVPRISGVSDSFLYFSVVTDSFDPATQHQRCEEQQRLVAIWELKPGWESLEPSSEAGGNIGMEPPVSFDSLTVGAPNPWVNVRSFPNVARSGHAAAILNDRMWFFGGQTDGRLHTDELFDLDMLTTVIQAHKPAYGEVWPPGRSDARLVADDARGALYLLGGAAVDLLGRTSLFDVWSYDVAAGQWTQLPSFTSGFDPYAPGPVQGTGWGAVSTGDYIVVVGSELGQTPMWLVFDKTSRRWQPPFADARLAVATPALAGSPANTLVVHGGTPSGALDSRPNNRTLLLDATAATEAWNWKEVSVPLAPPAAKHTMVSLSDSLFAAIGDPRGAGELAAANGVALFETGTGGGWHVVPRDPAWMPARSGFSAVAYHGRLVVFGGRLGSGGGDAFTGDVWVYDHTVCPQRCNGRSECTLGTCTACVGSQGVACEVVDGGSDWGLLVGLLCGGAVLFVVAALAPVLLRMRMRERDYQKLWDDNKVAEESAEKIATLRLDELQWLWDIPQPNRIQLAFRDIVANLKSYKPFLPQSLLLAAQGDSPGPYTLADAPRGRVTVCFTDIVGSTKLWEASPEGMERCLDLHNKAIRTQIALLRGYEVKTIGDAFMCSFTDPADAVMFGVTVQEALVDVQWPDVPEFKEISEYWEERVDDFSGQRLWGGIAIRAGAAIGDVTAEINPITDRTDYRGRAVNLAARCESSAPYGSTLISAELAAAVAESQAPGLSKVEFIAAAAKDMKGIGRVDVVVAVSRRLRERVDSTGVLVRPALARAASSSVNPLRRHNDSSPLSKSRKTDSGSDGTGSLSRDSTGGTPQRHFHMRMVPANASVAMVASLLPAGVLDTPDVGASMNAALIRCSGESVRTSGRLEAVVGSAALVTWNVVTSALDHKLQMLIFASRITSSLRCVAVGGASGQVYHGNVGTSKQRFHAVSGHTESIAEELSRAAPEAQSRCLVAYIPQPPQQLADCMRPVDVWAVPGRDDMRCVTVEEPDFEILAAAAQQGLGDLDQPHPALTRWRALFTKAVHQGCGESLRMLQEIAPDHPAVARIQAVQAQNPRGVEYRAVAPYVSRLQSSWSEILGDECEQSVRTVVAGTDRLNISSPVSPV